MNHDMADGRIPSEHHASIDKDIDNVRVMQILAIKEMAKFGLENPFKDEDTFGPTEEYWTWFRAWDGHIKGLSDEQWTTLNAKPERKADVSEYYPPGIMANRAKSANKHEERLERIRGNRA